MSTRRWLVRCSSRRKRRTTVDPLTVGQLRRSRSSRIARRSRDQLVDDGQADIDPIATQSDKFNRQPAPRARGDGRRSTRRRTMQDDQASATRPSTNSEATEHTGSADQCKPWPTMDHSTRNTAHTNCTATLTLLKRMGGWVTGTRSLWLPSPSAAAQRGISLALERSPTARLSKRDDFAMAIAIRPVSESVKQHRAKMEGEGGRAAKMHSAVQQSTLAVR